MNERCQKSKNRVDEILNKHCQNKFNTLENCDEKKDSCSCSSGTGSGKGKVDLVLLIDSSSSMRASAVAVNAAANKALDKAKNDCEAGVRTTWLWVDSIQPGNPSSFDDGSGNPTHGLSPDEGMFSQSHQEYLKTLPKNAGVAYFNDLPDSAGSYPREQGADAIADISKYFDWTQGACRAILYFSDTALEGVGSTKNSNDLAKDQAIDEATANNVTVFAHKIGNSLGGTTGMTLNDIFDDYDELCSATGGYAEKGGAPSEELYEELIARAICDCGDCKEVKFPELKPCISVSWGDSECDCMETDDFEILCISVCNCYSNVTFSNLTIGFLEVTDSDGNPVPNLPDGTPSVQVVPLGPICFGDIPPCVEKEPFCVSREFVINTRGAKDGAYIIKLGPICYQVIQDYADEACFKLNLCKS